MKTYSFTALDDGNGIIYSLGIDRVSGTWRNPVESKKLRVCASSLASGSLAMTVDHEGRQVLYQSTDAPLSWVLFDFQEDSIRPTMYTLAHHSTFHGCCMRAWQLEASDDNNVWHILSRHNNDTTLNANNQVDF